MQRLFDDLEIFRATLKIDANAALHPWQGRLIRELTDKVMDLKNLYIPNKPFDKDVNLDQWISDLEQIQIAASGFSSQVDKYVLDESNERDFEDSEFSLQDFGVAWKDLESTISAVVEDPFVLAMETAAEFDALLQVTRPTPLPRRAFDYMFQGLQNIKDPEYMDVYLTSCMMMLGGAKKAENMFRSKWGVIDPQSLSGPIRHLLDGSDAVGYYKRYGNMGTIPGLPETVARLVRVMDSSPVYKRDSVPGLVNTLEYDKGFLPGMVALSTFQHVATAMVDAFPDLEDRKFYWRKVLELMWPAMKLMGFNRAPFLLSGEDFLSKELRGVIILEKERSPSVFEDMDVAPAGARFGMDRGAGQEEDDNGGEGPSNRSTCEVVAEEANAVRAFGYATGFTVLGLAGQLFLANYIVRSGVSYVAGPGSVVPTGTDLGMTLSPVLWKIMAAILLKIALMNLMTRDRDIAAMVADEARGETGVGGPAEPQPGEEAPEDAILRERFEALQRATGVPSDAEDLATLARNIQSSTEVTQSISLLRQMGLDFDENTFTRASLTSFVLRNTGRLIYHNSMAAVTFGLFGLMGLTSNWVTFGRGLNAAVPQLLSGNFLGAGLAGGMAILSTRAANAKLELQTDLAFSLVSNIATNAPFFFYVRSTWNSVQFNQRGEYRKWAQLTLLTGFATYITPFFSPFFSNSGVTPDSFDNVADSMTDSPFAAGLLSGVPLGFLIWRLRSNLTLGRGQLGFDEAVDRPAEVPEVGGEVLQIEEPPREEEEVVTGSTYGRNRVGIHNMFLDRPGGEQLEDIRDTLYAEAQTGIGFSNRMLRIVFPLLDSIALPEFESTFNDLNAEAEAIIASPVRDVDQIQTNEVALYVISRKLNLLMFSAILAAATPSGGTILNARRIQRAIDGPTFVDGNFVDFEAWESNMVRAISTTAAFIRGTLQSVYANRQSIEDFLNPETDFPADESLAEAQDAATSLLAFFDSLETFDDITLESLIVNYMIYQTYLFASE